MKICYYLLTIDIHFLTHPMNTFPQKMVLEIGSLGACPQKNFFEIMPPKMRENDLLQAKNALAFIIKISAEMEKLALSNFEDLELKRKMLRYIILSTIACIYTKARSKTISSQNSKSKT